MPVRPKQCLKVFRDYFKVCVIVCLWIWMCSGCVGCRIMGQRRTQSTEHSFKLEQSDYSELSSRVAITETVMHEMYLLFKVKALFKTLFFSFLVSS